MKSELGKFRIWLKALNAKRPGVEIFKSPVSGHLREGLSLLAQFHQFSV